MLLWQKIRPKRSAGNTRVSLWPDLVKGAIHRKGETMNIRKNIDYFRMFAALDVAMCAGMTQMKLYCDLDRIVSARSEKGAAVAAAAYLNRHFPDISGFAPCNLRRMRVFRKMYADNPELLALAMEICWTQIVVILKTNLSMEERSWYLQAVRQFGWRKAELQRRIESAAHQEIRIDGLEMPCYTESKNSMVASNQTYISSDTK